MNNDAIVFSIFAIFFGAAVLSTVALYARQSLLVSYILLGILLGPWGLAVVSEGELIQQMSHVGVIFLLFLLGLNLHPQQLVRMMQEATVVTLVSSLAFGLAGTGIGFALGFDWKESIVIGSAAMFSSTIIGLKLLPTTALHHQHIGQVIISVLLLQDLIAIVILLVLQAGQSAASDMTMEILTLAVAPPLIIAAAIVFARRLLTPLLARFDTIHEYVFLVAIGWCLGVAEVASLAGLSQEIGAFIAGVALAASPISTFIAESLKPLRDFFLVLFFFSLGATFDLGVATDLLLPAGILAAIMLLLKPFVFRILLQRSGERPDLAGEIGVRLGQISEFSLFIAVMALRSGVIGEEASYAIQLATLMSFVASSYWVMMRYPNPLSLSKSLHRD